MNMRRVLGAAATAVLLCLGPAMAAPPEMLVLTIRNSTSTNPPVSFDHKLHWEKVGGCNACHHRDAPGSGQKCTGCHGGNPEIMKVCLRQAYHKLCMGCHRAVKQGPGNCTGCHRNERQLASQAGDAPKP